MLTLTRHPVSARSKRVSVSSQREAPCTASTITLSPARQNNRAIDRGLGYARPIGRARHRPIFRTSSAVEPVLDAHRGRGDCAADSTLLRNKAGPESQQTTGVMAEEE